ncbi:MAG: hypothetical protein LQ339_006700 [Xanthoria mediterranea]|nr:MAG: hypothetical protein LQ339_006700 [Xanthoria mediterranea]
MARTYGDAVAALNTLQTNAAAIDAAVKADPNNSVHLIPEMIQWCRWAGYEPADLDNLRPIHIAGTKGKGSTSAFISSILAQYTPSPSQPKPLFNKIGLYTSPHLRFVRERIRINNEPLSEELFAKYFWETWDKLEESARAQGKPTDKTAKPSYFRFLTLMAFHTYIREKVDTAIIECGIGGEYDCTNVIPNPSVTGITSLGIDHVQLLGNTIEEIAWHKAGIMKEGAPAYTVPQPPAAQDVLERRAVEKSVHLSTVQHNPLLENIQLGLSAPFQHSNASLAIVLAATLLQSFSYPLPSLFPSNLPPEFIRGLKQVRWPGRCEIRRETGIAWHLDSAHTLESIHLAASWFASEALPPSPSSPPQPQQDTLQPPPPSPSNNTKTPPRILLFNQQTRDASSLARALFSTLSTTLSTPHPFTHAVFCTNLTFKESGYRPDLISINTDKAKVQALGVQRGLRDAWRELDGECAVEVKGSIEEAVGWVRGIAEMERGGEGGKRGEEVKCLVTGSLHLVGGFLEVFEGGDEVR